MQKCPNGEKVISRQKKYKQTKTTTIVPVVYVKKNGINYLV